MTAPARCGVKPGQDMGGIDSYKRFLLRCRVDDDTGCLVWLPKDMRAKLRPGAVDGNKSKMTCGRAAWLLSGRAVGDNQEVHLASPGCHKKCVDPAHGVAVNRVELGAMLRSDGRQVGMVNKVLGAKRGAQRRLISRKVVAKVEAARAAGKTYRQISEECSVSGKTISRILSGQHPHCKTTRLTHKQARAKVSLLPHASIFALASRWGNAGAST